MIIFYFILYIIISFAIAVAFICNFQQTPTCMHIKRLIHGAGLFQDLRAVPAVFDAGRAGDHVAFREDTVEEGDLHLRLRVLHRHRQSLRLAVLRIGGGKAGDPILSFADLMVPIAEF